MGFEGQWHWFYNWMVLYLTASSYKGTRSFATYAWQRNFAYILNAKYDVIRATNCFNLCRNNIALQVEHNVARITTTRSCNWSRNTRVLAQRIKTSRVWHLVRNIATFNRANITTTMPSLDNVLISERNSFRYHAVHCWCRWSDYC